ncbi:MAG: glycerol-3-phosphate dehydrogenase/oxidase [Verrucomicrobia bacterium]|nr:glycerol-3-phosphate dehydrogenase/oxidase [Verrucomicrobiota bacterium]
MKRKPETLANEEFDIAIIGGGVHGLATAWDASLRGLRVALVEKSDFGAAASGNSFKLVHGGLRYLQHLDFKRMRESIRERTLLMYLAPHLVDVLEFMVPCYGHGMKGPEVLRTALLLNDMISFDRNSLSDPSKRIPSGRVISRQECLERIPLLNPDRLTGAGIFYDGQMQNSERLTIEFAVSADASGAVLANYVEAVGFLQEDKRVIGIKARDVFSGDHFDIRARQVIDLSGVWSAITTQYLDGDRPERALQLSKGIQLFVPLIRQDYAFAFESRQVDSEAFFSRGGRSYFVTPWHGVSFIGTTDEIFEGDPDDFVITEDDIAAYLSEINNALPDLGLRREDILFWNGGLRPIGSVPGHKNAASVARRSEIVDHAKKDGIEGIISAVGIKYTTCRLLAERVTDLACKRLGSVASCRTHKTRLAGGDIADMETFLDSAIAELPFSEATARRLARNYGTRMREVVAVAKAVPRLGELISGSGDVVNAEIVFSAEQEMAMTLPDAVLRRTDLGAVGHPGSECLRACAELMKECHGWSDDRTAREVNAAESLFLPKST